MNNIVTASFGALRAATTRTIWQYDYGMVLKFAGLNLPQAYTVHFANEKLSGSAVSQVGDESGVSIPDALLLTGKPVYAWIYLHTGVDDGETVYMVTIPVTARPQPTHEPPTPVQQDYIEEAIAALNDAVRQTGEDVETTGQNVLAAQAAQEAAEAAQRGAEAAQGHADDYAREAATQAYNASQSAQSALAYEGGAQTAQGLAEDARDRAQGYAQDAADSAEHAEQAATNAGWMEFHIDSRGHLIYTRIGMVDAEFALVDGHLVLEVA